MANEKILVVDDDTNICELLRLYLTKRGAIRSPLRTTAKKDWKVQRGQARIWCCWM